jgi:hypothetical protein
MTATRGRPKIEEPKEYRLNLRLKKREYFAIQSLSESIDKSMSSTIESLLCYAVVTQLLFKSSFPLPSKEQLNEWIKFNNIAPEVLEVLEMYIDLDHQFSEFSNIYLKKQ